MPTDPPSILRTVEELDAAWLARALGSGAVTSFGAREIGTGQMSESHRVSILYENPERAGPETIVLKLAASDAGSRATGVGLGIYAREVRFYDELAPRIGGPLPACALARYDEFEGWFTLLLEDAVGAEAGDQIAGCSVEQARLAIGALARLHAPVLGDRALGATDWLNQPSPVSQALVSQLLPGFLERYDGRIAPEHQRLCERFVARLDAWLADRRGPLGLVHGDFRLDNLLFGKPTDARPLTVVDWQTVGWGGAMTDAAYFLGGSLPLADRRRDERELFGEYHAALLAQSAAPPALEDCWREYRRHTLAGVLMAIVASMLVERTERGEEMFTTMLARHAQHALDLEAEALLGGDGGASGAGRPLPVLRAAPADEQRHAPGPEQLWNESWYFDAIDRDGSIGVWVRVGLYPNLDRCWYTALICGPGRPTIAVCDFAAPLPGEQGLRIQTDALRADHRCEEPLERFAVELEATGEAHEDPAALLRGESGTPVPVFLDLRWRTAGFPYAYRMTTRYEIPCAVTGTIRVGEETIDLKGAVGQRDHSWGTRDWWSMDWVWSAGHLDDGTHLHAVELRLPGAPRLGAGYVQPPDGEPTELATVAAAERVGADGLIASARLSLAPPGLEVEVEPLAHAPLLLVAPDGRVSDFARAMCRIRCADGRSGLAWVEWNLNRPEPPLGDDRADAAASA
jgi:hypothetical protein